MHEFTVASKTDNLAGFRFSVRKDAGKGVKPFCEP